MASTILAASALTIPVSTTRPGTPTAGMIRFNSTNNSYEAYHTSNSINKWAAIGGRQLVARSVSAAAWNTLDIVWGWAAAQRYTAYEVYWSFQDPNTGASRMYCQFYDGNSTLWQNSGANGYTYTDNWGSANDGADVAGANYNAVNSNCYSALPISNWYGADSGYWMGANGESNVVGYLKIHSSIPNSNINNINMYEGNYTHYTPSYSVCNGHFGGTLYYNQTTQTATNGQTITPITGIRFGYLDGYTMRASSVLTSVVTVYGLGGTEEREM